MPALGRYICGYDSYRLCRFSLRQSGGQMHRNIRLALVVAAAALGGVSAAGQSRARTPPRTPDRQPNPQGGSTNATITPPAPPAKLRDQGLPTEAKAGEAAAAA